jgi:hypothetical protein
MAAIGIEVSFPKRAEAQCLCINAYKCFCNKAKGSIPDGTGRKAEGLQDSGVARIARDRLLLDIRT